MNLLILHINFLYYWKEKVEFTMQFLDLTLQEDFIFSFELHMHFVFPLDLLMLKQKRFPCQPIFMSF